jgi:hypothetical protein
VSIGIVAGTVLLLNAPAILSRILYGKRRR